MDRLANMRAFAVVGQTGSFAEAARKLNLTNSVVSKRIKDLESHLQTQLFIRTTRKVTLTENGYTYLEFVTKFLEELEEVETGLSRASDTPVGKIKLAAPLSFGMEYLGPALSTFIDQYSQVQINTYLSDKEVNLIEEGYDLSIRIGAVKETSLIAKKLGSCRRVVCASPSYLAQFGTPKRPEDLREHNCLAYLNLVDGGSWPFVVNKKSVNQPVAGRFSADNGNLLSQAALSGCGIVCLPTFLVGEAIQEGKLEVVLEEFEAEKLNIFAVYQHQRHLSRKVRALIDHLAAFFKNGAFNI